jgi:hypothetical protein
MTSQRSMPSCCYCKAPPSLQGTGKATTQCSRVRNITKGVGVIFIGTAGPLQGKVPHDLLRKPSTGALQRLGCRRAQVGDNHRGHRLVDGRGPIRATEAVPLRSVSRDEKMRKQHELILLAYCVAWRHVSAEIAIALRWFTFTDSSFI